MNRYIKLFVVCACLLNNIQITAAAAHRATGAQGNIVLGSSRLSAVTHNQPTGTILQGLTEPFSTDNTIIISTPSRITKEYRDAVQQFFTRTIKPEGAQLKELYTHLPFFVHERYGAEGITALHKAVELLWLPIAQLLMQHHADIDTQRVDNGNTPLIEAATMANPRAQEIVHFLVEHGAHTDLLNKAGYTVLTHPDVQPSYKKYIQEFQAINKQAASHPTVPAWMEPINFKEQPWAAQVAPGEKDILFERENMPKSRDPNEHDYRVESYWASPPYVIPEKSYQYLPFPIAHTAPWPHQQEFSKKLEFIQQIFVTHERSLVVHHSFDEIMETLGKQDFVAKIHKKTRQELSAGEQKEVDQIAQSLGIPAEEIYKYYTRQNITFIPFKGGRSRFEDKDLISGDFIDTFNELIWTAAFLSYYVKQWNVIPNRAFYRYVMNLPFQFLRDNAPDAIAQINAFEKEWNNEPLIKAAHERAMQRAQQEKKGSV